VEPRRRSPLRLPRRAGDRPALRSACSRRRPPSRGPTSRPRSGSAGAGMAISCTGRATGAGSWSRRGCS
jgi:hypothetical protein